MGVQPTCRPGYLPTRRAPETLRHSEPLPAHSRRITAGVRTPPCPRLVSEPSDTDASGHCFLARPCGPFSDRAAVTEMRQGSPPPPVPGSYAVGTAGSPTAPAPPAPLADPARPRPLRALRPPAPSPPRVTVRSPPAPSTSPVAPPLPNHSQAAAPAQKRLLILPAIQARPRPPLPPSPAPPAPPPPGLHRPTVRTLSPPAPPRPRRSQPR